jgi:hypothetical protein
VSSIQVTLLPHPNPSPKEKGLKKKNISFLVVKVLSFGEDLGEAKKDNSLYKLTLIQPDAQNQPVIHLSC